MRMCATLAFRLQCNMVIFATNTRSNEKREKERERENRGLGSIYAPKTLILLLAIKCAIVDQLNTHLYTFANASMKIAILPLSFMISFIIIIFVHC